MPAKLPRLTKLGDSGLLFSVYIFHHIADYECLQPYDAYDVARMPAVMLCYGVKGRLYKAGLKTAFYVYCETVVSNLAVPHSNK